MSNSEDDDILSEEDVEEIDENKFESGDNKEIITQVLVTDRIYLAVMSLTEFVQVVCTRADQIERISKSGRSSKIYVENPSHIPHEIAIKEIIQGKCPLCIYRSRGIVGSVEYIEKWMVNELELTPKCISNIETLLDENNQINIIEKINNLLSK